MSQGFMLRFADQANDVLKAILDQSVDCVALLNLAGELEWANPNGMKVLGVVAKDALAGQRYLELWPAESRERADQALDRAQRGQHDRFRGYCPNEAGEPRWWDVSVSPIYDARGTLTHVLATSRDITEQIQDQLNERLRREEAERAAERSDSVAREMRHRLKNQLAVVSSVAKLLARHSADAPALISRLEEKLQALARAQDLLTINREQPIIADRAIAQVLEASGAGDRIHVGALPHAKLGDDAIQQLALILGELQTNSLKYGALGKGRGRIVLTGTANGRLMTLNWYEDTGHEVIPPTTTGAGVKLLERLGSVAGQSARVNWHETGPEIAFHIRVL